MTIPEMLGRSGLMTILGMGVVFGFLVILIIFMKIVEIVVKASGLDKDDGNTASIAASAATAGLNQAVAVANAAAVKEKYKN